MQFGDDGKGGMVWTRYGISNAITNQSIDECDVYGPDECYGECVTLPTPATIDPYATPTYIKAGSKRYDCTWSGS